VYKKEDNEHFITNISNCKHLTHDKAVYKYIENFVVPGDSKYTTINRPIAHFDVVYYCLDSNKTFHKELELDLLDPKNKDKFIIEYKEE
jgi:hypothetical protein